MHAAFDRAPVLVGVFAGGLGRRMGGLDKASLPAPDTGEPLLARLVRIARELALDVVILGGPARAGVQVLADDPPAIGPIGALHALLSHAAERPAIALACDLPHLQPDLLARLATHPSAAPVLAPRDPESGKWHPLAARYDAPRVLPLLGPAIAAGTRSFQTFLRTLPVEELPLTASERRQLHDWDAPADVKR